MRRKRPSRSGGGEFGIVGIGVVDDWLSGDWLIKGFIDEFIDDWLIGWLINDWLIGWLIDD